MGRDALSGGRSPRLEAFQPGENSLSVQGVPEELQVQVQGGHTRGCPSALGGKEYFKATKCKSVGNSVCFCP